MGGKSKPGTKQAYYLRNKAAIAAKKKAFYEANKERILAEQKAYNSSPERQAHLREYKKTWYQENKVERIAYVTDWRRSNLALTYQYSRTWKQRNKDHVREKTRQRRATQAGATIANTTPQAIQARVDYYGGRCAYCGGPFEHLDHVIPLSRGGPHCPANLRPACAPCNYSKNDKLLSEWH